MKIKVFEAFAGIGAPHKALINLKKKKLIDDFEITGISEIDKHCIKAYRALYNENVINIGDITDSFERYRELKHANLFIYGFPCQDLSTASFFHNKNAGLEGKRSGLLFEVLKLLKNLYKIGDLPEILLGENVPNLTYKKNSAGLQFYLEELKKMGYYNYVEIVNSYDLGAIQARKRAYIISSLQPLNIFFNLWENLQMLRVEYPYFFLKEQIEKIIDFKNEDCIIPNTPSRERMKQKKHEITINTKKLPTLTTKQDRFPNMGWVQTSKGPRFITPLEAWKLMGFEEEDYNKVKDIIKKGELYKMAGNSMIVRVIELIILYLYEKELNNEK